MNCRKADHRTDRQAISRFDQIINIGSAMTRDFQRLGFESPVELIGEDPLEMYQRICELENQFHDPCVLDTYMAAVDFMNGNPPATWWSYTELRKQTYSRNVDELRNRYAEAPAG